MRKLSAILCAAALLAAPVAVLAAQEAAPAAAAVPGAVPGAVPATLDIKRNKAIIDADGRPLGKVYEVNARKGVVSFMSQMKVYQVPISTLSSDGAKIRTTLTRAQIGL